MRKFLGALTLLGLASSSCSSTTRECNVGADCASGACSVDGVCAPVSPDAGHGSDSAGPRDSGKPFDSSLETGPVMDGGCVANDGGTILRSQVVLMSGLHATFRAAQNVAVDTAGQTLPDGSRSWDLSTALTGDHDVLIETESVAGSWYASSFGSATYASALSDTSNLLGVFQATGADLLLLGVVSPSDGVSKTELTYTPGVPSLQFPLAINATFSTKATVKGTAAGVPSLYTEDYQSTVDARGTLKTPLATFSVLRVGTVLTRTVGITVTVTRSFVWVTDCYGAVAFVTSRTDEPTTEFTRAADVRRIAP